MKMKCENLSVFSHLKAVAVVAAAHMNPLKVNTKPLISLRKNDFSLLVLASIWNGSHEYSIFPVELIKKKKKIVKMMKVF